MATIKEDYAQIIIILIVGILMIVAFTTAGDDLLTELTIENEYEDNLNDKPNLLLALIILIGLSFIVMIIVDGRKK